MTLYTALESSRQPCHDRTTRTFLSRWQTSRQPYIINAMPRMSCLLWDITVADTIAATYLVAIATITRNDAEFAAVRKEMKYVELSNRYHFFYIAIESHRPLNNKATSFLSDLRRRITISTSETSAAKHTFFFNVSP